MSRKWPIIHIGGESPSILETKIVSEFRQLFEANNRPAGMALFSYTTVDGPPAVAMTPASIPYCDSLLGFVHWSHAENHHGFGFPKWLAGDNSLKT